MQNDRDQEGYVRAQLRDAEQLALAPRVSIPASNRRIVPPILAETVGIRGNSLVQRLGPAFHLGQAIDHKAPERTLRQWVELWMQGRLGWFWIAVAPYGVLWCLLVGLHEVMHAPVWVGSPLGAVFELLYVPSLAFIASLAVLWIRACYRAGNAGLDEGASLLVTLLKWGTAVCVAAWQALWYFAVFMGGYYDSYDLHLNSRPLQITEVRGLEPGLVIQGDIGPGSARALRAALSKHPDRDGPQPLLIRLSSQGGLVSEAAQMRGQLLVAGVNTMAVGGCYSACTDLLITGRVRWLASEFTRVGFHRSGHVLGGDGGGQSPEDQAYVQWLIDQGVDRDFATRILSVPFEDIWLPSAQEMLDAGVVHWVRESVPQAPAAGKGAGR